MRTLGKMVSAAGTMFWLAVIFGSCGQAPSTSAPGAQEEAGAGVSTVVPNVETTTEPNVSAFSEVPGPSVTEEVLLHWWVSYPESDEPEKAIVLGGSVNTFGAPPALPLVFAFDTTITSVLYDNCSPSELAGKEYLELSLLRDNPPDRDQYLASLWDIVSSGEEPAPTGATGQVLTADGLNTGGGLAFVPKYITEMFPVEGGTIPTVRMARYLGNRDDAITQLTVSLPRPLAVGEAEAYLLASPPSPVWVYFGADERWFEYLASPSFHAEGLDEASLANTLRSLIAVVESKSIPKPKRDGSVGYLVDCLVPKPPLP